MTEAVINLQNKTENMHEIPSVEIFHPFVDKYLVRAYALHHLFIFSLFPPSYEIGSKIETKISRKNRKSPP